MACPNGMIYQECGTACPNTCENYADPPVCIDHCVDGCFCPPGQVLLDNSTCVDVEDCPGLNGSNSPNIFILIFTQRCLVVECRMYKALDQVSCTIKVLLTNINLKMLKGYQWVEHFPM